MFEAKPRFTWHAGRLIKSVIDSAIITDASWVCNPCFGTPGPLCKQPMFLPAEMFNWDCNFRPRQRTMISSIASNFSVHDFLAASNAGATKQLGEPDHLGKSWRQFGLVFVDRPGIRTGHTLDQ